MTNDWIIDVLMDLKKFSASNNLDYLAEHLDDAIMVAATEIAQPSQPRRRVVGNFEQAGRHAGGSHAGENA
ncbi:hypothetical protein [Litoreibacter ponti]|uniref:hypothetical protein n=1 Tax=Litoreibacter ponti TaxID=1510457 RepID=UPI0011B25FAD|nr:hypothetical protein [Litoreibacter ponti]